VLFVMITITIPVTITIIAIRMAVTIVPVFPLLFGAEPLIFPVSVIIPSDPLTVGTVLTVIPDVVVLVLAVVDAILIPVIPVAIAIMVAIFVSFLLRRHCFSHNRCGERCDHHERTDASMHHVPPHFVGWQLNVGCVPHGPEVADPGCAAWVLAVKQLFVTATRHAS
jgi:hypothetical protein